jgi:hypothetical protein
MQDANWRCGPYGGSSRFHRPLKLRPCRRGLSQRSSTIYVRGWLRDRIARLLLLLCSPLHELEAHDSRAQNATASWAAALSAA